MDAFEKLGLERSLSLEEGQIAEAFREAGKTAHPDAGGSEGDFEKLEAARRMLAEPSSRLKHWLELQEVEGDLRGSVANDLMDSFTQLSELLQKADALIREREQASSALAKAMLEGRTQEVREALEEMVEQLEKMIADRVVIFPAIESGRADGWACARDLAFLTKWQAQVRERFAGLW